MSTDSSLPTSATPALSPRAAHQRLRLQANLLKAIRDMQDACDQALRDVNDDRVAVGDKAPRVLKAFAWGFANASNSIENALSAREDEMATALHEQSTPPKDA